MAGIDAFGTQWQVNFGAGLVTIADVTSIDVLDVDVDTLETTAHNSPGQWREFVNGMKDAGELTMEINYDPALHQAIFAEVGGNARAHKIILPDAGVAEVTYNGLITGFQAEAPFDDKLSASVTVKVTGAVTIVP